MRLDPSKNPDLVCLYCGKKLGQVYHDTRNWNEMPKRTVDWRASEQEIEAARKADDKAERAWKRANKMGTGTYGRLGNNAFCTSTCAEAFALLAANAGYRLVHRGGA